MLVLKLAYNDELDFVEDLQELREGLKKKGIVIGLVESIEDDVHIIKIICEESCYNDKIKEVINLYVSNILYRIVVDYYRKKEIIEYLTENYFFLKQSEIIEVENQIVKVLKCQENDEDDNYIFYLNRINDLISKINDCISEKQELNINGFIRFRMKTLKEYIEKIISKVVERFIVEKEYREFIKLLKYFVEIQECKIKEINIIMEENNYIVKDDKNNDLYEQFYNEFALPKMDEAINKEDILISGLITSAPEKIIIHKKDKCYNKEFIDTIENVFDKKVEYCDMCALCEIKKIITKNIDSYQ